jgi:hypothetical protein
MANSKITGPWYVTIAAVEQYCKIKGTNPESDQDFGAAQDELIAIAKKITADCKPGKELRTGAIAFRGPKPLRVRLLVSYTERSEGNLPQLFSVQTDFAGRVGPYTRSAGVHRTKKAT